MAVAAPSPAIFAAQDQTVPSPGLIVARDLSVQYGPLPALSQISLDIRPGEITALIGPSGCGKTTFLRCLNRMNDGIEDCRISGSVTLDGLDIYRDIDPVLLRARVGMVFQKPNPFPKSIYDNVAFGPRLHGLIERRDELDGLVESCLQRVGLWKDVRDRLHSIATSLLDGQQQRLCIARAIAVNPDVLLMDEPCSALDPVATAVIEELMEALKSRYTQVIVTHSMKQAARISQRTAFFHMGRLVEFDGTEKIFTNPREKLTQGYITGRFG